MAVGQEIGAQNGSMVHGTLDLNLRPFAGLILTHTHVDPG